MFLKYTPITDELNQFYVLCLKQRNTKISLITRKRMLLFKFIRENQMNRNLYRNWESGPLVPIFPLLAPQSNRQR